MVLTDDEVAKGAIGAVYYVEETNVNNTPVSAAMKRVPGMKDLTPNVVPNRMPVTAASSKRQVANTQGGVWDISWNLQQIAWGDNWLDMLKFALGSATGTVVDRKPTFSLVGQLRDPTGAYVEKAELLNGCKVATAVFTKNVGADPFSIAMSGRAQWAEMNNPAAGWPPQWYGGLQGTVGTPINPTSWEALPAYEVPPIMYHNFREYITYKDASEVEITRLGGWELTINSGLKPIPDYVEGADGNAYNAWGGFGEEGETVQLKLNLVPKNLAYYEQFLADHHIDEVRIPYTQPLTGYSAGNKTIKLIDGTWNTGGWSIKELVLGTQQLVGNFTEVTIA